MLITVIANLHSDDVARYTDPPSVVLTVAPYGARGFLGVSFADEAITAAAAASTNPAQSIADVAKVQSVLLQLRTAVDVLLFHAVLKLPPPRNTTVAEQLYQLISKLPGDPVPTLRSPCIAGFRVTTSRCGHHSFTSKELEFEAGGALAERYKVTPQMRPDEAQVKCGDGVGTWVNVRVDVVKDKVVLASLLNLQDLSRRHKNGYINRVTIKTNIAAAMLRLAGAASRKEGNLPTEILLEDTDGLSRGGDAIHQCPLDAVALCFC